MSMDGKDLDKIEDQIRQMADDIEIPDALKPESVEKMLQEKTPVKKRKWKSTYTVLSAAACSMLVIGIAVFGNGAGQKKAEGETTQADQATIENKTAEPSGENKIASAKDYDEIYKYIEAERKSMESQDSLFSMDGASDNASGQKSESATVQESAGASGAKSVADSSGAYSDTNIRAEGVAEGDIVKTDGKNLYILNNQKVEIVNIENKEMNQEGTIHLDGNQVISEVYVKDGKLILVYSQTDYMDGSQGYGGEYKQYTVAETYDVSDTRKPKSIGKITQSGNFNTMRVAGGYVYLLSDFYANMTVGREDTSAYIPSVQGKMIGSGDILLPQYVRGNQYTVISTFSLENPEEKVDSKAIFGNTGLVYISEENIYVCESYFNAEETDVTQTCIRKVAYANGKLDTVGQTRIDGTLNDSFSIDEYEGNLRLVTTVSATGDGSAVPIVTFGKMESAGKVAKVDTNTLYVLDKSLIELGKIEGLAENERVYSARFMGEMGYFVTYRQVDPLFSVDLSNPSKPKVIGELKIPGFSEYLHPYGDGLLLGIGMDTDETGTTTNGVKLSMFDISNPKDVLEEKKFVIEDCYSTNVFYNYKAVMVSVDKNLFGFAGYGEGQHYYLFSYEDSKGFQCVFDRELNGYAEARGVYAGDTFYLVAGNTVESFTMNGFKKVDDIVL